MAKKVERLGSVRNGWPVVAIDPDLLEKLERENVPAETKEQLVLPSTTTDEKSVVVKPKLGK